MPAISSRSNTKIKQVRALRQRKYRQESGLTLVEGIHHVGEAVEAIPSGLVIESIFYAPDLLTSDFARQLIEQQSAQGTPSYETTADVFTSIASKENPQGILAVVRPRLSQLEQLTPEKFSWGVALVSPQDPGNIGTILRTIDAVGADGLLLLDNSADPFHPNGIRASMGAIFGKTIAFASFPQFAQWGRIHGYHIYGTSAHGSTDYQLVPSYQRPAVLLMGSEREGLTPEQASICQQLLRMPMLGRVTSLNLAVATGVMLYTMLDRIAPVSSHQSS